MTAGPATGPMVGVVVVGTNERKWLKRCLGSLLSSSYREGLTIWYVDNASHDSSVDLVREAFPEVQVVRNRRNLGFGPANNRGIALALDAGVDYVFLVNPDTVSPPGLVAELAEFMEQWPSYGIVGPMQSIYGPEARPSSPNDWTKTACEAGESHVLARDEPRLAAHPDPLTPRAPDTLEHGYVQGAALFARATLLRRIGSFDPAYRTFYEEVDLCRRARLSGARVALLERCWIAHKGGGSTFGTAYRQRQMLRNKYYFLATYRDLSLRDGGLIALRWLEADLSRTKVEGGCHPWNARLELVVASVWFIGKLPRIFARRRMDARIESGRNIRRK